MKLLSIHIENYGKLKNVNLQFNDNLTEIFKENGYGKTTIASFIKAMFYGLPSYKINSVGFDDRQHFYPYDNAKFGGNLRFEFNNDVYLIERYFDKKSDTKDSLKLYKNDKLIDTHAENLGKYFFELDENSFEKTLFFNSNFNEISSSTGINAKLNNFVDSTSSDMDFDTALKKLEKKQKDYKKSRNGESFISKTTQKIKILSEEIQNLKTKENSLQLKYKERNALRQETERLSKLQEVYNDQKVLNERWNIYENYLLQISETQKEKNALLEKYPNGVLSSEDFSNLSLKIKDLENKKFLLNNTAFDNQKLSELNKLSKTFENSSLDKNKLQNARLLIEEHNKLKTEESTLSNVQNENSKNIVELFEKFPVDNANLDSVKKKVDAYSKNVSLLENFSTSIQSPFSKIFLPFLIGALLCLGGVFTAFTNLILSGILALLGLLTFAVPVFLTAKNKFNSSSNLIVEANKIKSENEILEREIRKFLSPYNVYSEYGVLSDFNSFINLYGDYLKIKDDYNKNKRIVLEKSCKINQIEDSLNAFFKEFNLNLSYQENFEILKTDYNRYLTFQSDYLEFLKQTKLLKSSIEEDEKAISLIFEKYGVLINQTYQNTYNEIEKDLKTLSELEKKITTLNSQASLYKTKYSLTEKVDFIKDESFENLKEYQARLVLLDDEISVEERDVETLIDKENQLEKEKENLQNYTRIYENLSITLSKLQQAEDNLRQKYVFPIKEKFENYAKIIESTLGEKMYMDKDYSIKFERNGEMRSYKHLSLGQLSICSLCLRLSLLDNMFLNDKPFIIMDDPFVDLDKVHFERVKKIVNKLAESFQIVYMTCHESRSLL